MTEYTRWVVIDDTDSRINYSGTWSSTNGDKYNNEGNFGQVYRNTLHSTTASSSLSFTFTGNAAKVYGTTALSIDDAGVSDPDWDCILDGSVYPDAKVKPFPYIENNWEFCNFVNLSAGQHSISLAVKTRGRAFLFDRIHYRPTVVVENETIAATRDDLDISYDEGKWGPLAQVAYFTAQHGGSVSFSFIGTGIELRAMAPTELPHGPSEATYSIDGGDEIPFTIREARNISHYNRVIFETPQLSSGRHVLKVTYRGASNVTPLVVAGFIVTGGTNRRAPEPVVAAPIPSVSASPTSGGGSSTPAPEIGGSSGTPSSGNAKPVDSDKGNDNDTDSSNIGGGGKSETQPGAPTPTPDKIIVVPTTATVSPGASPARIDNNAAGQEITGATSKGTNNTGAIVGGTLGALAIIIITAGIAVWLRRRKAQRRRVSFNAGNFAPYQQPPPMAYASTGEPQPWSTANTSYAPSSHGRTPSDPRSEALSSSAHYGLEKRFDDSAPPVYRH